MKKVNIKLKTLKDLIQNESRFPKSVSNILISDLKSAAIEWIKDIKEHMKEVNHSDSYHQGSIDWIEIFFNLNENKRTT